MRTEKVSAQSADRHYPSLWPVDQSRKDEPDCSHEVDQRTQYRFNRVHLVDVSQPHKPEGSEHENADAGSEVTSIHSDRKLEKHCTPKRMDVVQSRFGAVGTE